MKLDHIDMEERSANIAWCIKEQREHLKRLKNKGTYVGLPFSERLCKLAITDWWLEEAILRVRGNGRTSNSR